jgi:hypothetical protein
MFIDRVEFGGSILFWFTIVLIVHVPFTLTMLLFQLLIHGRHGTKSHPFLTLIAFFLAQTVRGYVSGIITVYLGFTDELKLGYRTISGGFYVATVLAVLAITLGIYLQHSKLVNELQVKSQELSNLREKIDIRLTEAIRQIGSDVQTVLTPRVEELDKTLASLQSGGSKNNAIKALQSFVDSELRPLSRQVTHEHSLQENKFVSESNKKRIDIPKTINLSISMRPRLTSFFFFITYTAVSMRTMSIAEALPFLITTTLFIYAFFLAAKYLFANKSLPTFAGVTIGIAIFIIAGPAWYGFQQLLSIEVPKYIFPASLFISFVFACGNLGHTLLTSNRTLLIELLEQTISQLEQTLTLLKQREWVARRRIGFIMHGSLQSSLNSALIQLGASQQPSAELIDSVRGQIRLALGKIGVSGESWNSFAEVKQEISQVWSGTIEIDWDIDPNCLAPLNENPETAECVIEVIREAVSNAAKHGGSSHVAISLVFNDSSLALTAIDNGTIKNTGKTQGLGSEFLDDVCSWWELTANSSSGMTLSAIFPIDVEES